MNDSEVLRLHAIDSAIDGMLRIFLVSQVILLYQSLHNFAKKV